MPLGRKVDLGLGDIVLDGDPAPPKRGRGTAPPVLAHVYYGRTAGWIKMKLAMKVGLIPGPRCVRCGPSSPSAKRGTAPNFRPMSVVAKRLDGSRYHSVGR